MASSAQRVHLLGTPPYDLYEVRSDNILHYLSPIYYKDLLEEILKDRTLPWEKEGIEDIPLEDYSPFILKDTLPRIEESIFLKLVVFYADYALGAKKLTRQNLEVGAFVLLKDSDHSIDFGVVEQVVSPGHVEWNKILDNNKKFLKLSDAIDQEPYPYLEVLANYSPIGYSHSHNTMMLASPSNVDDATEVVDQSGNKPTGLHILLSCFKRTPQNELSFQLTPSLSLEGKRYFLAKPGEFDSLIPESLLPFIVARNEKLSLTFQIPIELLELEEYQPPSKIYDLVTCRATNFTTGYHYSRRSSTSWYNDYLKGLSAEIEQSQDPFYLGDDYSYSQYWTRQTSSTNTTSRTVDPETDLKDAVKDLILEQVSLKDLITLVLEAYEEETSSRKLLPGGY